jgi:LysM repeat protein
VPGKGSRCRLGSNLRHTIKKGETLSSISSQHHMTIAQLATANSITDPDKIKSGQKLVIPRKSRETFDLGVGETG